MSKVGRNELCPCGSGKKYKKCCLNKGSSPAESILRLISTEQPVQEATVQPESKLTPTKLKRMVTQELKWEHPSHEQLALELIENMRNQYEGELISEALMLWNGYSRQTRPTVKKTGSFCAAIEYLLSEEYGFNVSKPDMATKYEVTTGTISRKVNEMFSYIEEYGMGGETDELMVLNGPGTPKDKAEALLHKAREASSAKRKIQLAKTVLEVYPDSSDAYLILAEESDNESDARAYLKAGIAAGERELGDLFFEKNKGHFWGLQETRPYIRVCKSYAESCWFGGDTQEAAQTLERLLELNTEDNTGARYLLAAVYLYSNQLKQAEQLMAKYGKGGASTAFAYDQIILEYKKNGITSQLEKLYRVARGMNKHVPDYLLGLKRLPHNLPDFVGMGDSNEAIEYVIMHSRLWASMPDLLKWMLKQ